MRLGGWRGRNVWEYDCKRLIRHTLRFVLGAVSPAVVVLSMLMLQERGYGVEKGIPTLLIAASSCDDIVALTGFNTFLGMAFSTGTVTVPQKAAHTRRGECYKQACSGFAA